MLKHLLKLLLLLLLGLPLKGFSQSPFPKWVDDLGGSGDSKPTGMISDKQNNVYVAGYFSGTVDFDPSPTGVKNLTSVGGYDIYVAKYDINGKLLWATSMGGEALDQVNNMTVDPNGNPTITGQFQSSTLTAGTTTLNGQGGDDTFIIHLDTNGNILWAKSIGGFNTDRGEQITADLNGNLISTSIFQSTIVIGGNTLSAQGGFYGLISKYDSAGNLIWYISLGNSSDTEVFGAGTDKEGNVCISGTYSGDVDFDPLGAHKTLPSGFNTPFVAKYSPAGKLIWINAINGAFLNNGSALSVDTNDDIYITAAFSGTLQFDANNGITAQGSQDFFIAKYLSAGTLKFIADMGGAGASSVPYQIRNDNVNNVYVAGYFSGTIDFDPSSAVANVSYHGQRDLFLSKLDKDGKYQYAFSAGSANCDLTLGIELAVFNIDDLVVGGSFCSTVDFDPSSCAEKNVTAQNGISDSFVVRYIQGTAGSSQITAFTVPQQTAAPVIDQVNHTITVTVSAGTNLKALTPAITASNGGVITPASGVTRDFSSPVSYQLNLNCESVTYTVTVTTAQTVTPVTVCLGVKHTLAGDKPQPLPDSYLWQQQQNGSWVNAPGNADAADYETAALPNTTGANLLYHLRRQTVTAGVVKYDSYYDVTVQPVTAITNNTLTPPATAAFCASGDPAPITGSTPAGGSGTYTYQWQSSADGVTFANITSAVNKDYDPPVLTVATYFRRVVTSGSCTAPVVSNIVTISVVGPLANNVLNIPSPNTFCSPTNPGKLGGSDVTGGGNGLSYQWQSSTDGISFTNVAGNFFNTYGPGVVSVTTYYRRLATSGPCATPLISNVIELIITAPPTNVVADPAAAFICTGSTAKFTVNSPQTGVTYKWYDSQARTTLLFTGTVFSTPALTVNKTYYVEGVSGSCSSPALTAVSVTVSDIPAQPAIQASAAAVCAGSPVSLAIVNPQSGITYNWYASASATAPASTGPTFDIPAVTATITYYAEAVNSTGCASATRAQVTVTANPVPVVTTTGVAVCPNSAATVTAATSDAGATIRWYAAATGGTPLFTGANYSIANITAAVSYYAEAVDNATGCTSVRAAAAITLIKQLDAPVVAVGETTVSSISFTWGKVTGATGYEVSLDNGKTFTAPSSGSAGLSHTVSNLQLLQSVTIIVRATGSSDCQLSANSEAVTGEALSPYGDQIYVPNAFTPNGDGKNDIVYVHSESIQSLKFYVYDQWGELLYTSLSQQNGWDGSYKGAREPVGVYVYFLEAKMNDGQTVKKKGTITILR